MRKMALLVMVYEGIVAQVLDYDYAPASELVEGRRKYFNVSQEGKSDIDFLREEELINGLKLSSKEYQPVTCFQISEKGADVARKVPKLDKEAVHELVYAPGTRELLEVEWREEAYWLGSSNFERESTVTDCEDVSYVSSAYVPQCLRFGGRPTLSNAHRAHECGVSDSNIRDELDEAIVLSDVMSLVGEWIPFGANQIVALNERLGYVGCGLWLCPWLYVLPVGLVVVRVVRGVWDGTATRRRLRKRSQQSSWWSVASAPVELSLPRARRGARTLRNPLAVSW